MEDPGDDCWDTVLHQDAMKGTQTRLQHALKKGNRKFLGIQVHATQLGPAGVPYGDIGQPRDTLLP